MDGNPGKVTSSECVTAHGDKRDNAPCVHLAVFDFDGTVINGNSPVLLVYHLAKQGLLRGSVLFRILLWAAAYKLSLPQNEASVRGLVFSAFQGWPVHKVDDFLAAFYDEHIAPLFRTQADAVMQTHRDAGDVVVMVSATFEPIVLRAMQSHPFDYQISTRMRVAADNTYTDEVEGLPVEGEEKLAAVQRFADTHFGSGNWEITTAYGDHHSDAAILSAARHACVVSPDRPLARTAKIQGWEVLTW